MFREKVKEFLNIVDSSKTIFVFGTLGFQYERPNDNVHIVTINDHDIKSIYGLLKSINNSYLVFDDLFYFIHDKSNPYEELNNIINYLSENSKSNNNIIFT